MATAAELHTAALARLRTITTVGVHDADVPKDLPAEDGTGRVYPYLVLWPSAGYRPDEARAVCDTTDGTELDWPFQITAAAGTPTWALQAADLAREALEGHRLVPGAAPLHEDQTAPSMQTDRDVTPYRYFIPLLFRAHTA